MEYLRVLGGVVIFSFFCLARLEWSRGIKTLCRWDRVSQQLFLSAKNKEGMKL